MGKPLHDGVSVGELVITAIARGGELTTFIDDHACILQDPGSDQFCISRQCLPKRS